MPAISHIFISPAAKLPMQPVERAAAIAHVGLDGDRYAAGVGSWSDLRQDETRRDVTLISADDAAAANARMATPCPLAEMRRNLVVSGAVDLLSLIGKEFTVGTVRLRGVEEAAPCAYLQRFTARPGLLAAFDKRAGIRAEFLSSGEIKIGDPVQV